MLRLLVGRERTRAGGLYRGRICERRADQIICTGLAFDLNALRLSDAIVSDQRWGGQINFPVEVCRGSFLPAHFRYFFVDPGTKAKYSFVAAVPENSAFLLLHCYFQYVSRGKTGHTAEKTLRIQGQAVAIAGSLPSPDGIRDV